LQQWKSEKSPTEATPKGQLSATPSVCDSPQERRDAGPTTIDHKELDLYTHYANSI